MNGQGLGLLHSSSGFHAPMELDNIEGLEADTSAAPITRAELQQLVLNAVREGRGTQEGHSTHGTHGKHSKHGKHNAHGSRAGAGGFRALPIIPHLTPDQVTEYMAAGKCFGCGAKDHSSRGCPKRKVGADGRVSWSN